MKRHTLILILLLTLVFSLAAWVQPRLARTNGGRESDNVFKVLFGEGRRMFANHFATKADVYLHSGFYPSIFDQAAVAEQKEDEAREGGEAGHLHSAVPEHDHDHDADQGAESSTPEGHKCDTSFMKPPIDCFEAMGRHFMVTQHSHLSGGNEREILPWLKLSADLDPQREETYTVAAYWLAQRLNKPEEAEDFLRQGLRANPQSYEILFQLGEIYDRNMKRPAQARGLWLLALRRWDEVETGKEKPDKVGRSRILENLARLELNQQNAAQAIRYFEEAKNYSPDPDAIEARIREVRQQIPSSAAGQ
jgi:tetratricopeptide (TPR) repeat protein